MRHRVLWLLILFWGGCVISPPVGTPVPPRVEIVRDDSAALRYGSSAAEVFAHPTVGEKARSLFGTDWTGAPGTGTSVAAPDFFSGSLAFQALRIGEWEYTAVSGCLPTACATHRGLLLIRSDGERLLARLDEAGFTHYYGFGIGVAMTPLTRAVVDRAWDTLEAVG